MARIRTVKPDMFISETLAGVSITAERTFVGLLTEADDHGRYLDNAAIIAGRLWPLRVEHTSVHVEDDLHQLAIAGLICRYTGCDGRRYLHIVTWAKHQKIDKPSQSRRPSCPEHHAAERCGPCKGICASVHTSTADSTRDGSRLPEASPSPTRAFDEASPTSPTTPATPGDRPTGPEDEQAVCLHPGRSGARETPGESPVSEGSGKAPRALAEGSAPGSRILDPGSKNPSGRDAPAPGPSARTLLGEYVAACPNRPPARVLGHLGREINQLLDEGIDPDHIRAGLERFRAKPMHPSALASLVNEAMNANGPGLVRPGIRPNVPGHTAWTNPVDAAAAYAEEL
ncbi:hypothetical protein [Streptomyces aidingensis]|uniref:Phage or prophage related protein n=1 Tax=Streptomyces aidingensis TaxID=910347 RepID=A0A1I1KEB8_9ACTN|nr:hypothetical protein [Streptomyces aidingensis]SFC59156.1 hypothetical protein SAMN05421773_104200 [Streptomyces aidingensis]